MKLYIILLCLFPVSAMCQQSVTVARDTIVGKVAGIILSNDKVIMPGDQIKCGRGTMPNGDFKYIHLAAANWTNIVAGASGNQSIGRQYSGLKLDVKKVEHVGNKRRGYKYILKVGGGNIVNYECELEDAIATGEIIL